MRKRSQWFFMTGVFLLIAVFGVGLMGSAAAQAADKIRIGVLFPRSGPLGALGEEGVISCQIAADLINKAGGINGKQIELVIADLPDTAAAQSETNRLCQREKLKILTGTYASSLSSVSTGVANRNGALYWEMIAVADKITDKGLKGIFRTHFKGSMMGESSMEFAAWLAKKAGLELKDTKVAVLYENSDFGQSTGKGMIAKAKELGMQVVLNESYIKDLPDTSPIVLKVKSVNPDFVVMTPYINDGINFIRNAKNLDLNPKAFIGLGSGFGLQVFWDTLKENAQGMFDCDPLVTPNMKTMRPDMKEPYLKYKEAFNKKTGHDPGVIAMLSFQGFWVLANDVVAKVKDPNNLDQLIAAAMKLDIPKGALPTGHGIKFDKNGQNLRPQIGGMQWQNSHMVSIYPPDMAKGKMVLFPFPGWGNK